MKFLMKTLKSTNREGWFLFGKPRLPRHRGSTVSVDRSVSNLLRGLLLHQNTIRCDDHLCNRIAASVCCPYDHYKVIFIVCNLTFHTNFVLQLLMLFWFDCLINVFMFLTNTAHEHHHIIWNFCNLFEHFFFYLLWLCWFLCVLA